jgi:hypothetical protein
MLSGMFSIAPPSHGTCCDEKPTRSLIGSLTTAFGISFFYATDKDLKASFGWA